MMKQEFENLVGREISADDYSIIEDVYMYYPGVVSKQQIADLYTAFGLRIFKDMMTTVRKIQEYERGIEAEKVRLAMLEKDYKRFLEETER